jgi:hypothetical protein
MARETIRGLRGDGRDERFAQIDLRATAFSGLGADDRPHRGVANPDRRRPQRSPYDWLLATAGLAYLLAVAFSRWRG